MCAMRLQREKGNECMERKAAEDKERWCLTYTGCARVPVRRHRCLSATSRQPLTYWSLKHRNICLARYGSKLNRMVGLVAPSSHAQGLEPSSLVAARQQDTLSCALAVAVVVGKGSQAKTLKISLTLNPNFWSSTLSRITIDTHVAHQISHSRLFFSRLQAETWLY
jgi:hypothetical protein